MNPYLFKSITLTLILLIMSVSAPEALASVESSLMNIKTTLLGAILPIFAAIGVAFAAFSFFTGNINAKSHLLYSLVGCALIFGAQAIVDFVSRLVR